MKIILSFSLLILAHISFSQDINYARKVVQKLASDEFKGRGYVGNGDGLAAQFITREFKTIGLKSFKKSFPQKFNTPVNTFPGIVSLKLDGVALKPGIDFLVDPASPGFSGRYPIVRIAISDIFNPDNLRNHLMNAQGKIILIDPFERKDYSKEELKQIDEFINLVKYHFSDIANGIILLTNDKLTWGASTAQSARPTFVVKVDSNFSPPEFIDVQLDNVFISKYKTQNVIGYVEGQQKDSLVVFIAHYDHLGMMGNKTVFPGANDNASGIAMLLSLARHYQVNQPKYSTVFIAFGGEELGLLGSKHFVENPLFDLKKVKFLVNFDISGTGDEGIQVVNGSVYKDQFDRLSQINQEYDLLPQVKIRGAACNSDHCMFDMKNVPNFFIYTLGGIQAYHDIYDKAETLPLTEFEDYFRLITEFVNGL